MNDISVYSFDHKVSLAVKIGTGVVVLVIDIRCV